MNTGLQPQTTIKDRFVILRQLGHGQLGRTYLAEDRHRFNDPCILQEFAPDVHDSQALEKTKELFQRKAQILYTLNNPQIPRFRELFSCAQGKRNSLFLVQDYVTGFTYRELLQQRLSQRQVFTETEVTQFLLDSLPVLAYIHEKGIIHRDITPDKIICRDGDQLPVFIDFGSVKQLSVVANTYFKQPQLLTSKIIQIGQPGYAPQEQIQKGIVSANSDLYSLAATASVLLTGKEPQQLQDAQNLTWRFPAEINVSFNLTQILGKMLAKNPSDRYHSAQQVIDAIKQIKHQPITAQTIVVKSATILKTSNTKEKVSPKQTIDNNMTSTTSKNSPVMGCLGKLLLILMLIVASGTMGWWAGKIWVAQMTSVEESGDSEAAFSNNKTTHKISDQELERKTEIRSRRRSLGVEHSWFVGAVDELFWHKYPSQKDKFISYEKDDIAWRKRRDEVAIYLLDILESISTEGVKNLGSYSESQRGIWKQQVNGLYLSSRALYDLVDGRFFAAFPEQKDQDFINNPIGQVWNAMILDTLTTLQSGESYEKINVNAQEGNYIERKEKLQPGRGKAYVANLKANEAIKVNLQGDRGLLLSIYSPTGNNNILEDSSERQWSGELIESGYYEFTIVSQANRTANYKLTITIID